MSDLPLAELLALRAGGAALLGVTSALLLWVTGWLRAGGAAAAGAAVGAAYVGGGWAPGALVALTGGLPGLARGVARRWAGGPVPGASWGAAGLVLPGLVLLARPALPADAWVVALAAGALAGLGADAVRAITEDAPGRRYRLHVLRPASPGAGTPSVAALAGAGAAAAIATAAWSVHLLGPGDPALVALAGTVSMVLVAAVRDRTCRRAAGAPLAAALAAASGGVVALALVAFIP